MGKTLKKVLKKVVAKEAHEQLAITDAKLGGVIKVSTLTVKSMSRLTQKCFFLQNIQAASLYVYVCVYTAVCVLSQPYPAITLGFMHADFCRTPLRMWAGMGYDISQLLLCFNLKTQLKLST